ncbi:glutamate 5-kinase [Pseudoalteromonas sp. MSK9-3]|uniref:glutamate 5-kinase n=1 Tax=Pseudoalteromonas sp. MSK9-3 TaxID=1897633 RepID=UPI000E6CC396|nr:glutamate 5-kinase [Pseudoalteromonas sp. MSK9-3]RJE76789.1 glutamate 5-kinase [Pseudoalteromonas sp. MSK9-3]
MMNKNIVVIKFGTSVLTAGKKTLNKPRMVELVRQCVQLKNAGYQLVLVSSGAVAAGRSQLTKQCGSTLKEKQMLAAIGQGQLIHMWQTLFSLYDISVAQMLLTRADVEHRDRYLTARDTLTELLHHDVVPIINENDAVSTAEITVGDNDNLSAMVAILANANKLILLTDQSGLFTADPRNCPDAQLISEVHKVDDELRALAGGSGSSLGTGGMATKLQAADIAQRAGVETIIAKGSECDVITQVINNDAPNTTFLRFSAPVEGRKKWLLSAPKSTGALIIDTGACEALINNGASLLAKGVISSQGQFKRGDLVTVKDQNGRIIAKGLCGFSDSELRVIKGWHSSQIEAELGCKSSYEVLHRDDMVLLECVL